MSIKLFLIFGIVFLLVLALFASVDKRKLNTSLSYKWWIYTFICLLGLLGLFTAKSYIYPKKAYFKNVDYHVFEHKGYRVSDPFILVNEDYAKSGSRSTALWDSKTGFVKISKDSIEIKDFFEPFYVESKAHSSNKKADEYVLANRLISADVSDSCVIRYDNMTYSLTIKDGKKGCMFISSFNGAKSDTSRFTRRINRGYPLAEIIASTPSLALSPDMQQLLEGVLLVREKIGISNSYGSESSNKNDSELVLMPGENMIYNDAVTINGEKIKQNTRFSVGWEGKTFFFSGIGRTKSDIYKLSLDEENFINIRYVLPKMQKLKEDGGQLFITSSINSVLKDSKDGGYFYSVFESEDNINNIDGSIKYVVGTAKDNLVFEVVDVYSENPTEKRIVYARNDDNFPQEFSLRTKGDKGSGGVEWVFEVVNLRETNALQLQDIILFVLLFLVFVGLRFIVDQSCRSNSLSYIEIASYVFILSFCIVRLILGWRASTFVATEDISAPVFYKMRQSILLKTCLVFALPVALIVVTSWSSFMNWLFNHAKWAFGCINWANTTVPQALTKFWAEIKSKVKVNITWPFAGVLALFVLSLITCFALGLSDHLNRIMNIPAPFILYLLFDYWIALRGADQGEDTSVARILLGTFLFTYIAIFDAGFAIVLLIFWMVVHGIIGSVIDRDIAKMLFGKDKPVFRITIALLFAIATYAILQYEGDIMLFVFNYTWVIVFIAAVLLSFVIFINRIWFGNHKTIMWLFIVLAALLYIDTPNEAWGNSPLRPATELVNSKDHMKFRAEIQKLKENESIDKLMVEHEFDSSDITFIMRSAHNQWFINQYLKAGERVKGFTLQPHSNQGSTYTTQTTDLVITRYVIAEHGKFVALLLMVMLLLLSVIYIIEGQLTQRDNRMGLEALILMFIVSLLVYLSATNKIVFIGQDFPLISIQSLVAVLFPTSLLFIAIMTVAVDYKRTGGRKYEDAQQKYLVPGLVVLFALISSTSLRQQGAQDESQFNVSQIVADVSERVDRIDNEFERFQRLRMDDKSLKEVFSMRDTLWGYFNSHVSVELDDLRKDTSKELEFQRSLFTYFNERQTDKTNPEEFIHLRKRNGIWHLAVNKKHYFIPSMMDKKKSWSGNLYAAKTKKVFSLSDRYDRHIENLEDTDGYEKIALPNNIFNRATNIDVFRFDGSFGTDGEPIILIRSASGSEKNYFNIDSYNESFYGAKNKPTQIATRIKNNDLISLYHEKGGNESELLVWKYGVDNENYLAKNIWMNGSQKMFYPLGKESMWSYQFANLVSDVLGSNEELIDSSIRVSIDYDLTKELFRILEGKNNSRLNLRESTVSDLSSFKQLKANDMLRTTSKLHFDRVQNKLVCKKASADMSKALSSINKELAHQIYNDNEELRRNIVDAIDATIEKKYDFSAVAIDGNGRIRLLFDHSKARDIDPNNIRHMNKFISDMYKDGDNSTEREVFGNKALQIIPSGPGSTFKPIAYTAVTSQKKLDWRSLSVVADANIGLARNKDLQLVQSTGGKKYDYYGGVNVIEEEGHPLNIDDYGGYNASNYLVNSDNLYHSVVILLGLQKYDEVLNIFRPSGQGAEYFPTVSYSGQNKSFNPDVWFEGHDLNSKVSILPDGLRENYHLETEKVTYDHKLANYYGSKGIFDSLYVNKHGKTQRGWAYAETGSLNVDDMHLKPFLRNGFNQMLLGASPLSVSPLQMATMGMRLITLNRAENITTLDDDSDAIPDYKMFKFDENWTEAEYFSFYKDIVLSQLHKLPTYGSKNPGMKAFAQQCEREGYYLYAKTGTLNDGRDNASKNSRMRHFMVIISNSKFENVQSINDLKDIKYYALYLSYIGLDKNREGLSTDNFVPMIEATMESELFRQYMNE